MRIWEISMLLDIGHENRASAMKCKVIEQTAMLKISVIFIFLETR